MEQACPVCDSLKLDKLAIFPKDFNTYVCSDCSEVFYNPTSSLGELIVRTIQDIEIPNYQIYKFIKGILQPTPFSRRN